MSELYTILKKIASFCEIKEGPLSMQFFYENGEIYIGEFLNKLKHGKGKNIYIL